MHCENGVYGELPVPEEREGYVFAGWFTKVSGGVKAESGKSLLAYENHSLYAHFTPLSENGKPVTHTVKLKPDSGKLWIVQSTEVTPVDTMVGLYIDPDNIHIMKKSGWSLQDTEDPDEEGGDSK